MAFDVLLRTSRKMIRSKMWTIKDRIFLSFPYNPELISEIKSFDGAKWHGYDEPPVKAWSIKDTSRNKFQLEYLLGNNPYSRYDSIITPFTPNRSVYIHQGEMVQHGLSVRHGIWAAEMACGKTLAAIELMEASGFDDWYWIGPKSALFAVKLEFRKWKCKVNPTMMTYERLRSVIASWTQGDKAPHGVIFDESQRVKTPTALRSQAAMQLADGIRNDWGLDSYIILMSGAPAPKSPADWWMQSEIACPGFIKEGDLSKFKNRLSIVQMREQIVTGGVYPHLVTWLDNELKCAECGELEAHPNHNLADALAHRFTKSKNEVEALYRRLKGLVVVYFKKDCLDLPDKIYKIIECKPTPETLRVAEVLVKTAPRVITGLERMRELSDGFQYSEEVVGRIVCPLCKGGKEIICKESGEQVPCDRCGGEGEVDKTERITQEVPCPKVKVLESLLDEYEDAGRVVIYGGFTASIDRVVKVCQANKWAVLRADGRGWMAITEDSSPSDREQLLTAFDRTHPEYNDLLNQFPRIAFVGQPGAAGVGLNLMASPVIIYYSNDFNADSRIQSEDRIHRPGMDYARGATIIDIVHLETDVLILNNLKKKRDLQAMSLGDFKDILNSKQPREVDTILFEESDNA